jgi:hypothetical protein
MVELTSSKIKICTKGTMLVNIEVLPIACKHLSLKLYRLKLLVFVQ